MLSFIIPNIVGVYAELVWVPGKKGINFLGRVADRYPLCSTDHGMLDPPRRRLHMIQLAVAGLKLVSEWVD